MVTERTAGLSTEWFKKRLQFLKDVQLGRKFTPEEAKAEFDIELEPGWSVKIEPYEPAESGYAFTLISPQGWEIRPDETFVSPTGQTFTREEIEAQEAEYEKYQEALATVEPYKTPEGLYDIKAIREAGISEDVIVSLFGEVPLAAPPAMAPIETEQLLTLLSNVYAKYPGYKPEEIPQTIANLREQLRDDPEGFLEDLYLRTTPENAEAVLRMLGVPEENVTTIAGAVEAAGLEEERMTQTIQAVFPDFDIEDFTNLLEENPALFWDKIQTGDSRIAKRQLLEVMGYEPEEINRILSVQKLVLPVDGIRKLVVVDMIQGRAYDLDGKPIGSYNPITREIQDLTLGERLEDFWDAWSYASISGFEKTKQFFLSVLPEILFRDMTSIERKIQGDEWADETDRRNKAIRDWFRAVAAKHQRDYEEWVARHPELQPKPYYEEGPAKHPDLWADPSWWAYEIASMAPMTLTSLAAGAIATMATGGNVLAGAVAAGLTFGPVETQGVFEDLIAEGVPREQASELAALVGVPIILTESAGSYLQFTRFLPQIKRIFRKELSKQLVKLTTRQLAKKGLTTFTTLQFSETMEEVIQEALGNVAVIMAGKDRSLFENIPELIPKVTAGTLPFSLFGTGVSLVRVSPSMTQGLSEAQMKARGWIQDIKTGNWYQTIKQEEGFIRLPGEPEEAPLTEALIKEGETIVSQAEAIQPESQVVKDFREALEDAKKATGKAQRDALTRMEALEPEVRAMIPKAEPAMPEAGYQPAMFEEVIDREVRPRGKGELTQISMEDQLKLEEARRQAEEAEADVREAYEAQAELEGLKITHELDPVATYRFKMAGRNVGLDSLISIREGTFPSYLTLKQARAIKPYGNFTVWEQKGTREYNRVPKEAVLDELANKWNMTPDEIADRVMAIRQEKQRIKEAKETIKKQMTEKPLPPRSELTPAEVTENWEMLGRPRYNLEQIDALVGLFAEYVMNPNTVTAYELTRQMMSQQKSERLNNLKAKLAELQVQMGEVTEEQARQIITDTLSGEYEKAMTDFLQYVTGEMRDAHFAKVAHVLKDYPAEYAGTITALVNALDGRPIPNVRPTPPPGGFKSRLWPQGASALDKLQYVFGDKPRHIKALQKMAEEGKPLDNIIEGVFHETGREPIPIDQDMAEYLRKLSDIPQGYKTLLEPPFDNPRVADLRSPADLQFAKAELELGERFARGELTFDEYQVERMKARDEAYPPIPPIRFDPPVDNAFKQAPLMNFGEKQTIVRILKELGMIAVDIGSFLRANMASFDMSFWRQQKTLIAGHPVAFYKANVEAFKSLFSQKSAEATWEWITHDPLYHIYDQIRVDFLRPLEIDKGTERWRGVEEFGYLTGERLIPRLTAKIPWIKYSSRAFVTGTNVHNWLIFKTLYQATQRRAEKIATREIKLKEGEVFDITQEMRDYARMIADFTQRAQLGKAAPAAPALGALFFAPRSKLGRLLTPRHLLSSNPRVRAEAWKDLTLFVTAFGGLVMAGAMLGLWDVETDPRSAEFMSIRIGKMRIDPWGGYRQFLVFFARILSGTGISSVTGAEYEVNPIGAFTTFMRTSLAPMPSLILDFWTGKNFLGEKVDVADKKQWAERIAPFSLQDMWDAFEEHWKLGVISILPAIFGEGVQTYSGDWEENWTKLGIPKYLENTTYGLMEPRYDMQDFYADHSSQFEGVDTETLTEARGYPPYIKALAEVKVIKDHLDTLPNVKLVSINDKLAEGKTLIDLRQLWAERQKLVNAGDKAEYTVSELQPDGKYKDVTYKGKEAVDAFDRKEIRWVKDVTKQGTAAALGNISQKQYALLMEYWVIEDKTKQAEFLEKHEGEIDINPRHEYLVTHPKENALLAIFGQAKIFTKDAYNEFRRLADDWDVPDAGLPEMTMPPETSLDTHWQYQDMVAEGKHASWEAQLLLLKDAQEAEKAGVESYAGWAELTLSDTPIEALELKVKNREHYDAYELLETDDEREQYKADNPEWVDDMRRIEAIENNGIEFQDKWVDRGKVTDEFGSNSSEALLWLLDNPEVYQWAIENELLTDRIDELREREPILRINVQFREQDEQYDELKTDAEREAFLYDEDGNPTDYCQGRYRRQAYEKDVPERYHPEYIEWYTSPDLKKPDDWEDRTNQDRWYEDDWYLMEHPEFHQMLVDKGIFKELRTFENVPTKEVFNLWLEYNRIDSDNREERYQFRLDNPDLDKWGVAVGIWTKKAEPKPPPKPKEPKERRTAGGKFREALEEGLEEFKKYLEGLE